MQLRNFLMEGESDGTGNAGGTGTSGGTGGDGSGGTGTSGGTGGDGSGGSGDSGNANPHAGTWFEKADPEIASYITNKGWNEDPLRVVASYQHAEKLIGKDPSQVLVLPRQDDPDGQKAFWAKLGAGETPDAYAFNAPEGMEVNPEYKQYMAAKFHELGLPVDKAEALFNASNEFYAKAQEATLENYEQKVAQDEAKLKEEWGNGFDKMIARAANGSKQLGIPPEAVDAIEATIGYAETMKLFANIGGKMVEDKFVNNDNNPGFSGDLTPAEAQTKLDALKLDPNFVSALTDMSHPGHKAAVEKRRALLKIAYPESSGAAISV